MSDPRLKRRALSIFDAICDLAPAERAAVLDQKCQGETELRRLVEALLQSDDGDNAPIGDAQIGAGADVLAAEIASDPTAEHLTPKTIGPYRIIGEIGRGGMGVVYEAEQDNPRRRVALKVIRQGFASRQLLRRFENEVDVLGRLDHVGIASIYEAGSAAIGNAVWPYFAMEFIDGLAIDQHIASQGLTRRDTLELVARVCDAVQHAHQKGVIHRDLKPGNILVKQERTVPDAGGSGTYVDAIGQPKILDFGIARAAEADLQLTSIQTHAGQIVGTLAYMAPEQVLGRSEEIDTRCDVYALGVVLYRLLAGRLPHAMSGVPIAEAARIIREEEPRRLASIDPTLRGDVDTIVAKAIAKDSGRRYTSAAELAEDIRRHLRNEPISAHPPSALYQLRKFARRNRTLVGGVVATIAALICGLVAVSAALVEARTQRDLALNERQRVEQVVEFQGDLLRGMDARDFGGMLIDDLRADYLDAVESEALLPEDREQAIRALDAVVDRINETSLARRVLRSAVIERALAEIESGITDDPLVEAHLRHAVGVLYLDLGFHADAFEQFDTATEMMVVQRGPDDRLTVRFRSSRGHALMKMGRLEEARTDLESSLEQRRAKRPSARSTLQVQKNLADVYRQLGDLETAERLLRDIIEINTAARGAQDVLTSRTLNTLGVTQIDQGKLEDAYSSFRAVIEAFRQYPTSEEAPVVVARNNAMSVLFRLNRMKEAEVIGREILEASTRVSGDGHPNTILAHNNLGRIILDLGRPNEAEPLFRKAYALSLETLAPHNPRRQASAGNLIDALLATDRAVEAEALCRELLSVRRTADPPRPGAIAQTLEQLCLALLAQGRFEEAEAAIRECIQHRESINPDHWLTHRARSHLGGALMSQGRTDEARVLLIDSAEAIDRLQGTISPNMRQREVESARARAQQVSAHLNGNTSTS